jgi:hypothetical protein
MGVSLRDLRRVCQEPVRDTNDVAGLLYGDRASLPITKVMVDLRLSPNWASIGFFLCGIAGAALEALRGEWALAASALLVLYYVLDCVDGEVARWQRVCDVKWGYFDYLFHMLVKPLVFFGVGFGVWRELGSVWLFGAAFFAGVATLWLKIFIEVPGIVFLKEFLKPARAVDFIAETAQPMVQLAMQSAPAQGRGAPFRLRANLVTLRALMTNFDVGLLLLLAASVVDLFVEPFRVAGFGPFTARALWLGYYGLILPIDFFDYLSTYVRTGHFSREVTRLLGLAHHFSLAADEDDARHGDAA